MVGVPDLHVESCWYFRLGLVPREHRVLATDDDLLLGQQVVEWKDEAPVEITFAGQRPSSRQHIQYRLSPISVNF